MEVDLADVRSFLLLAREGHYGRTARRLHLTPSALTRRVQRLEAAVGEPLLLRDSGGTYGLTPAGTRFALAAPEILAAAARAMEDARASRHGCLVRLGLPGQESPGPCDAFVESVRAELTRRRPEVTLQAVGIPFGQMWECLRAGTADVVLNAVECPDPGTVSTRLAPMRRIGVVGRRHPWAGVGAVPVEAFAEQRLLDDPLLPREWASLWWLGDVRGRQDARIHDIAAPSMDRELAALGRGDVATVTQEVYGRRPGPWHPVELLGVPPTWHYADRRRDDRRPAVTALVAALGAVLRAAAGCAPAAAAGNMCDGSGAGGSS